MLQARIDILLLGPRTDNTSAPFVVPFAASWSGVTGGICSSGMAQAASGTVELAALMVQQFDSAASRSACRPYSYTTSRQQASAEPFQGN